MKKYFFLIIITFIYCSVAYSQTRELKFDMKYQIISNDFLVINDTLNHKIGKAAGTGSAVFRDGSSAEVKIFFVYDYVNGNGDFIEYYLLSFPDKSTLTVQAKGRSFGSSDESMPLFTAQVNVTGGSGEYHGYTGSGSMSGNRKNILEDGAVVKLSFNITLR